MLFDDEFLETVRIRLLRCQTRRSQLAEMKRRAESFLSRIGCQIRTWDQAIEFLKPIAALSKTGPMAEALLSLPPDPFVPSI